MAAAGPDTDRRWAPVAPIAISVVAVAVSAAGTLLVRLELNGARARAFLERFGP